MHATCTVLFLLDLISLIKHNFLQPPVTSSLLGPNILLSTLFPNTLNLHTSLNVKDQFSHLYKTGGKVIIILILGCSNDVPNLRGS
jgi:hypothetical protein